MDSFYKFWDKVNGKMYETVPPPVKYDMQKYPYGDGGAELKPLTWDDMASHSRKDVEEWLMKYGTNTTKLGPPMTDAELKKFYGQTW
jgi:hypothetical protein